MVRLRLDLELALVIDVDKIAARVHQLDSDEFAQREMTSQTLADLGPAAEAALCEALGKAGLAEVKRRLVQTLEAQEPEHRRLGHAVEVLEMIGTPMARRLLAELAKGARSSRLTRETRVSLDRLNKQL